MACVILCGFLAVRAVRAALDAAPRDVNMVIGVEKTAFRLEDVSALRGSCPYAHGLQGDLLRMDKMVRRAYL